MGPIESANPFYPPFGSAGRGSNESFSLAVADHEGWRPSAPQRSGESSLWGWETPWIDLGGEG
jgi:hypothetical protein